MALDNDEAGKDTTEKLAAELDKLGIPEGYKSSNEALKKEKEAFIEKIRQAELV